MSYCPVQETPDGTSKLLTITREEAGNKPAVGQASIQPTAITLSCDNDNDAAPSCGEATVQAH